MFFTAKDRKHFDDMFEALAQQIIAVGRDTNTRINNEVVDRNTRIDAVLALLAKEPDTTDYAEPKRVTENDEAAAQKDSA